MELQDYLKVLARRKWIVIQALVVVTAVAIVASAMQKPSYQATATLLVKERGIASTLFGQIMPELSMQPERGLRTQADLVKLRPVSERVVKQLDLNLSPDQLIGKMSVEVSPQSNLMTITISDEDPRMARRLADAMAEQYVVWNKNLSDQEINRARDEVQAKLQETEKNMVQIAKKVRKAGSNLSGDVQAQWGMATTLYGMLAEKYEQLRIVSASSGGDSVVVAPAVLPTSPVSPKPARNGILGVVLGLALGAGFAFLFEYLDNTLKSREDVDEYIKLPVLGEIPIVAGATDGDRVIISLTHPQSIQAEAFRMLRSNIHYLGVDQVKQCFVVSSPGPNEGKSTIAANLAVAFSRAGKRALIVCCDLRKPVIHKMFGLDNRAGLTNVLCDRMPLSDAIQVERKTKVRVLTSGPTPPDPSELLGSKRMAELIEEVKADVDVVVIDAPPIVAMSDVLQLAPLADGVIVVARAGATTRESATHAREILEGVQANILGVVLNGVSPSDSYGYYDYYSYHEKLETPQARDGREAATAAVEAGK